MKKQWKRLLTAATLSTSVFALTWYWYQQSEQIISRDSNEKPLAYVGKAIEEIQRRPASRLLWQLIDTGDPLYNGEAIRTNSDSEVRILFVDSDRYLDLEPDSLIVIKKTEGSIALDLMEGSLFVNAVTKSEEDTNLVLNSADGTVDLSKASATLSKSQGKKVEVQVLTGSASIESSDGVKKEIETKTEVKIISPTLQIPFFANGNEASIVPFEWTGFPEDSEVKLWTGSSRKNLKTNTSADPGSNRLSAKLSSGKHFWQLVATRKNVVVAQSPIFRIEVVPRFPPTVIYPQTDAVIPSYASSSDMTFRWQRGVEAQTVLLTIAKDANFQQVISNTQFKSEDLHTLKQLPLGTYFWKIESQYSDTPIKATSSPQKFTLAPAEELRSEIAKSLKIHFEIEPKDLSQQYITEPQMKLSWKKEGTNPVNQWRLKVKDTTPESSPQVYNLNSESFVVPLPQAGRYIASLEAVNEQGFVIGEAPSQTIQVSFKPLPENPILLPAQGHILAGADGRVQLEWTAPTEAAEYLLKIFKNGKELRSTKYKTTQTSLKNLLPGTYTLEISSIDKHGRNSTNPQVRTLVVPDLSNIRAPAVKRIQVN